MKHKILFIEDDMIDRLSLQRLIKNYENTFTASFAGSFQEAKELINCTEFNVIVTDFHLGDGDGKDVIKIAKEVPVIIVTGANDVELAVNTMKAGAFDFLIKDNDRSYLKMIPLACESAIQRKAQELLLKKMVSAVEQSPSLILITNHEGIIEYVNPKFTELTGYTQEELSGQTPSLFKSGFQDEGFYKKVQETIVNGNKWTGEFYNKTKSGHFYWEFSSIAPIFNISGEITHYVKVGEDITEKKKVEEEKINNEKLKSILELAGTVSHEINQPLQIIMGYSELLMEKSNSDPSLVKTVKAIITNIERIVDITNKIRNITEYKTRKYMDDTDIIDLEESTKK